jgi:predicted small metal-binding protein
VIILESSTAMTKGQMKTFTCPACGWTVKSPWGENDVADHANLHSKNHHPEIKMSEDELNSMIK